VAELAAVYLITGTDRPKVGRALRRLRGRIGDDATEILSAHEAGGEDVVASCNALGLFAVERRLVIVEDVQRWKAADLKALGEYLPRPAPTSVLVLVGDEVKPDSPLAKAVAEAGEVLVYDLPKRGRKADLPRWVEAELRERGVLVDHEAARAIVELVGDNANELATEVDKLATWADDERIGEREVVALVPARAEAPPFDLTDAWGARDVPGVLAASLLDETTIVYCSEFARTPQLNGNNGKDQNGNKIYGLIHSPGNEPSASRADCRAVAYHRSPGRRSRSFWRCERVPAR